METRGKVRHLLIAVMMILTFAASASENSTYIQIENATLFEIVAVYAATEEDETWGENRIEGTSIGPGESLEIEIETGFYWLKAEVAAEDGHVSVEDGGDLEAGITYQWTISEESFYAFDELDDYYNDTYGYYDDESWYDDTYEYYDDTYEYYDDTR